MTNIRVHQLTIEEFTPEAFQDFGDVLTVDALPKLPINNYSGANSIHGPVVLEADKDIEPEFILMRSQVRPFVMRYLERHVRITQTFIPLEGKPYVFVGAPPQARLENGFPSPDELRVFLVPGHVSINLHRGTWHEPAYPLQGDQMVLITSHAELTTGLQTSVDDKGELAGFDVDKRSPLTRLGLKVTFNLPGTVA